MQCLRKFHISNTTVARRLLNKPAGPLENLVPARPLSLVRSAANTSSASTKNKMGDSVQQRVLEYWFGANWADASTFSSFGPPLAKKWFMGGAEVDKVRWGWGEVV